MEDVAAEVEPQQDIPESEASAPESEQVADQSAVETADESTEHVEEAASGAETSDDDDEALLVSREELEAIKKDPVLSKLYKSLNRGYTQKSQARAKQIEYVDQLTTALRTDPRGTVTLLAQQVGLQLTDGTTKSERKDEVKEQLVGMFGNEIGGQLATIVNSAVDSRVAERTKGLEATSTQALAETHRVASEAVLQSFAESHPDFREVIGHGQDGTPITLEQKMTEMGELFTPTQPMDENTYLQHLYKMAKASLPSSVKTKQVIERLAASASASESPANGAPVAKVAAKFPTGKNAFKEAFRMATRGQRAAD